MLQADQKDKPGQYSMISIDPRGFTTNPLEPEQDLRPAVQSKSRSFFYISSRFESLDYDIFECPIIVEDEKSKPYSYFVTRNICRILSFGCAGIIIAVIGTFIDLSIQEIGHYKYLFLSKFIDDNYRKGNGGYFLFIFVWYLAVILPVMISTSLVVFIAPYAAGGGVAQTIAYLNGVRVPNLLSVKGLFVKMFSTVFTCTSGLAGGKEGPMLHMGATVGGRFPDIFVKCKFCPWCHDFQNDQEKRDLAAAGFAAGIACAFNAPVGGLLLAVEEGISYWDIHLMWKIFVCSITSVFFIILLMSIAEGAPGYFNNPELLTLGKIEDETTQYEYFELLYFILVGAVGGLLGSLVIYLHMHMTYLRRRYINTRIRKLIESFATACLIASLPMIVIFSYKSCRNLDFKTEGGGHAANKTVGQIYCPDGEYSVMTLLIYQTQEGLIHIMFSGVADDVDVGALLILFALYLINIHFTMGLTLSAGIFVPQIVFGAIWGRLFGLMVRSVHGNPKWALPSKYAFLGAAAQLSGSIRKTFSVMVIMIEASGNISFAIPLMLVVTTVRIVGDFFTMPIYELQAHMMGLPLLSSDPPPLSKEIKAMEVMSSGPLTVLPVVPRVREILITLDSTKHNGFPVVQKSSQSGLTTLKGLILRHDLLVMLKYKMYKYPQPKTNKDFVDRHAVFKTEASQELDLEQIEVKEKYFNVSIELTPYMNAFPYTRNVNSSLTSVYKLFRSIGLRHIVISNDSSEPVGMITRKDLAKYHVWQHNCTMGIKELKLRVQ